MTRFMAMLGFAVLALMIGSGSAQAYLDPGTGSIILQAVIGGIAGGLVLMRIYWAKVKAFVRGQGKPKESDTRNDHR
jgi:membrane associated rhomboid family serine protease